MAKGYTENEQAFGVWDVAIFKGQTVKVTDVIVDVDGSYFYEVETGSGVVEVPQKSLEQY